MSARHLWETLQLGILSPPPPNTPIAAEAGGLSRLIVSFAADRARKWTPTASKTYAAASLRAHVCKWQTNNSCAHAATHRWTACCPNRASSRSSRRWSAEWTPRLRSATPKSTRHSPRRCASSAQASMDPRRVLRVLHDSRRKRPPRCACTSGTSTTTRTTPSRHGLGLSRARARACFRHLRLIWRGGAAGPGAAVLDASSPGLPGRRQGEELRCGARRCSSLASVIFVLLLLLLPHAMRSARVA